MQRESTLNSMIIQVNPDVARTQFAYPILLTYISRVVDDRGNTLGQEAHTTQHAVPADLTEEVVGSVNAQLALVGLKLVAA